MIWILLGLPALLGVLLNLPWLYFPAGTVLLTFIALAGQR
jgi:hypothetical protein